MRTGRASMLTLALTAGRDATVHEPTRLGSAV